jgi:superfamily I DNA and/or RNA helicase
MTSTKAATEYELLSKLKCPVVIMEEAGELLESQCIASLSVKMQHLILIGDHQQLRPKVNNYDLEKNYNFAISLFERLLNLNIPKQMLETQLRMRPEICHLIARFYEIPIQNHPRVLEYPKVKGISKNIFFVTHDNREKDNLEGKAKVSFRSWIVLTVCSVTCLKPILYLDLQNI